MKSQVNESSNLITTHETSGSYTSLTVPHGKATEFEAETNLGINKKNKSRSKYIFPSIILLVFGIVMALFVFSSSTKTISHVSGPRSQVSVQGSETLKKTQEKKEEKLAATSKDTSEDTTDTPNIIFILMDDMGYSDMSARGGEFDTPNLDSLYSESIIINSHYIGLVCSPSRSQIITGRYAWNIGLSNQIAFGGTTLTAIPNALPTLAELLNEYSEYKSYYTGKWHMGFATNEHLPLKRGFEKFYGFYTSNIKYSDKTIRIPEFEDDYIDWRNMNNIDYDTIDDYSTYVTGDKLLDIINNHLNNKNTKNKPFYIHAPFQGFHATLENVNSPNVGNCDVITKAYDISHTSEDGTMSINLLYNENDLDQWAKDMAELELAKQVSLAEDEELTDASRYDSTVDTEDVDYTDGTYYEYRLKMCQNVLAFDKVIGELMTNLKNKHNIWDNTLIIFTSDNGATYNDGGCNYPLRGTKDSYFEGGIRTLAFLAGGYVSQYISNSDDSTQETRTNGFMHGTDWTPTILGFAGIDVSTVEEDLQNKLYIPVAKQASINEYGNSKYYKNYLMETSFDGNDISQWLLTGQTKYNPRTKHLPLSINILDSDTATATSIGINMARNKRLAEEEYNLEEEEENGDENENELELEADDTDYTLGAPDYSSSIIFTSDTTNHLYKLIYMDEEIKHLSKKAHYCTFRTVIDDSDSDNTIEYSQRTQTVGVFVTTNAFLFDLTLDESESTNLLELLSDDNDDEDESQAVVSNNDISDLEDYSSGTVATVWNEGVTLVNTEYIDNNPMFNDYLMCQQTKLTRYVDPSLFDGAYSPFYTWDEYTTKFDSLCGDSINPVLSVMYTTQYQDYNNN